MMYTYFRLRWIKLRLSGFWKEIRVYCWSSQSVLTHGWSKCLLASDLWKGNLKYYDSILTWNLNLMTTWICVNQNNYCCLLLAGRNHLSKAEQNFSEPIYRRENGNRNNQSGLEKLCGPIWLLLHSTIDSICLTHWDSIQLIVFRQHMGIQTINQVCRSHRHVPCV